MLGSRKFLIFVLCLAVVGSLFALSMFAEDRVRGDDDLVFLRSSSEPQMILTPSGLLQFQDWLTTQGHTSFSTAVDLGSLYLFNSSTSTSAVVNHFYSTQSGVYAYASSNPVLVVSPLTIGFDSSEVCDYFVSTVGLSYSDISFVDSNTNIINASLDIGDSIFTIGGALVAFVTSSWITIVALVAVLLVLGVGVIRKLVKGV